MADAQEFYLLYQEEVHRAARKAAQGASWVDVEDIENEIWAELLAHLDYNAGLDPKNVNWLIHRKASTVAANERRDYDHFRGAFTYTPAVVKTILADAIWCEADEVPDIEARIDVANEFAKLPLRQKRVLFRHYAAGEVLSNATDRKDLLRAVDRITDRLNEATPTKQEDLDAL